MKSRIVWPVVLAILVLSISFCAKKNNPLDTASEDAFLADTAAVHAILDINGLTTISYAAVTTMDTANGLYRAVGLNLNHSKLQGGTISSIPANLGVLTALGNLAFDSNSVTSLPAEIRNLVNLTSLSAIKNQLGSLPDAIGQCSKLRTLNVSDNMLQTIPSTISSLTQLRVLDLRGNQIATIPDAVAGLTGALQGVFVDNNKICAPSSAVTTWLNTYAGSSWSATQVCP
jgi:hypothetical protein